MIDYPSIFQQIVTDPEYLANLDYGEPRPGHPEGSIRAHITELEQNLEILKPHLSSEEDYWKLKILIHVHDTFKKNAVRNSPILHSQSHASLARDFLSKYCDNSDLQEMVQWHDEPYAIWRAYQSKNGKWSDSCKNRFSVLVLGKIWDWNLFLIFLLIDNFSGDKKPDYLVWFCNTLHASEDWNLLGVKFSMVNFMFLLSGRKIATYL